ncbi:MAG: bifunctional (p)ppGpp synthetase/guanosine-3',5'-bis(diphosphate) 3'-pyrophosphohydrolase [Andreesenia angusta]|nr:bifunctional (p)ppGpp synthetase/guanosine-3',5'-bis(diphosphate) 3'-pyrophosphohydrolase [Andreesenia angusta]
MLDNLIEKILSYSPNADIELVKKAYYFAEKAHEGQYRKSGESYFIHPVNVAMILAEYNMDTDTICGGLLHDVLEDTDITCEEIIEEFNRDIAELVDGVTKLKKLDSKTKKENQGENLRKMIIAMAKDIRVVIIKLADRLHNVRTLQHMPDAKKKEKALETLEIYAPLANRLGMSKLKAELEDISLRYMDPEGYYDLVEKVDKKRAEREEIITKFINIFKENLDEKNIEYDISGRPKHFYSIYKKMYYQNKNFNELFDLTAVRVLVNSKSECYTVLGIAHDIWKPIPGRFKDYIAMPKPNNYQSLHTTVIGPGGEPCEVQIRTWEMHKIAEYGIAAHWQYKQGQSKGIQSQPTKMSNFDEKLTWLRQLIEWQKDLHDPEEFVDSIKVDLFAEEVFVFTPQGDVVNLPNGSTPIDFAYRIHTDVGDSCTGAKVDGRIVPLDFKLKTGNIVSIITSKANNGPSRDWLRIVKSSQARTRIKNWFKKVDREDNIIKGRENIEKDVKRYGYKESKILKEEWLKKIAEKLNFNSIDDMYASVGYGSTTISAVVSKLKDFYREEYDEEVIPLEPENQISKKEYKEMKRSENEKKKTEPDAEGVIVKGIDNLKIRFSGCCNPVPGDEIIGYITKGRGISVHRKDCPNIVSEDEKERFIEVEWADETEQQKSYVATIEVKSLDRTGLLTDITMIIANSDLSITALNTRTKDRVVYITITMTIKDIDQLKKLMRNINRLKAVIDVYRVTT